MVLRNQLLYRNKVDNLNAFLRPSWMDSTLFSLLQLIEKWVARISPQNLALNFLIEHQTYLRMASPIWIWRNNSTETSSTWCTRWFTFFVTHSTKHWASNENFYFRSFEPHLFFPIGRWHHWGHVPVYCFPSIKSVFIPQKILRLHITCEMIFFSRSSHFLCSLNGGTPHAPHSTSADHGSDGSGGACQKWSKWKR